MITQKIPKFFSCEKCDYTTSNKKDYNKHLSTAKHLNNALDNAICPQKKYVCENCNKNYNSRYGLWSHKKRCFTIINEAETENKSILIDSSSNGFKIMTDLMIELVKSNNDLQSKIIKSNNDLQKQVVDMCQKMQPINSNNINVINSNNKTFNLNFFLNEECKDAMNLSDFVNSIKLKLSDLENIGKIGYVDGISDIMIKELNEIEVTKRPVHCSDAKRETLYVKEENKWEKDTDETKKMVKAIRDVDKKASILLMTDWKDANPDCINSKSKQSEMFVNLTGEISDCGEINVKKVIKKLAKEVVIDK